MSSPGEIALAGLVLALTVPLPAQMGDHSYVADDKQHPPNPDVVMPPSPVLSPEEAVRSLTVPAGFHVELVAAEPLVQDPVAMAFDSRGRLWVVEYSTYDVDQFLKQDPPLFVEPGQPAPPPPKCRIVILEAANGGSRMNKRTVFLDNLKTPRSAAFFRDGILIADPPNLWLYHEHDGVAGARELVAGDYGGANNVDFATNGLVWGRDNWLYSVLCKWRMRNVDGRWIRESMPDKTGQWNLAQDDYGRLFYGQNTDHLRGDWFPAHYQAKLGLTNLLYGENFPVATDQSVWPSRPTTGVNRSYRSGSALNRKGILHDDGYLSEFTAASGPVVYRGSNFPARYSGNIFVPDPAANFVKRDLLVETEGRVGSLDSLDHTEFLTSTSERFRPVFLSNGPDGALYVADMSRGIIEAYFVITSYLRDQVYKRGLNKPLWGMGRIYRVVYDKGPRAALPDFEAAAPDDLVRLLADPNGWTRDTAQRKIVESNRRDLVEPLNRLLAAGSERDRVYALWCLEGLSTLTSANLKDGYSDPSPKVRMAALRAGEPLLQGPEGEALLRQWSGRVETEEPIVLVQLALSLIGDDSPEARDILWRLLPRGPEHPSLIDATLLALHGREEEALAHVLAAARGQSEPLFGGRILFKKIARNIVVADKASDEKLMAAITDPRTPYWGRIALMEGIDEAHASVPTAMLGRLAADAPDGLVRHLAGAMSEKAHLEEARLNRLPPPLRPDQQVRFNAGRETFAICAVCHQPKGEGREGLAPPLQGGRWSTAASSDIPIMIVLKGKTGTPGFAGSMIPFADTLSNEQIAEVLTYVRLSWQNNSSPVDPGDVARVRAQVAGRVNPWIDAELQKFESAAK